MDPLDRLPDAWGRDPVADRELVDLIHTAIRPAIGKVAATWHRRDLGADAEQEFWIWLLENHMEPLRKAIHGHTAADVRGFLYVVAIRRANRWFRDQADGRRREQQAIVGHTPQPPGPTEAEVRLLIAEIEPLLTRAQREALHELLTDQPGETGTYRESDEGEARPPDRKAFAHTVYDAARRKLLRFLQRE